MNICSPNDLKCEKLPKKRLNIFRLRRAPHHYNKSHLGKKYQSRRGGGGKNMNSKFYIRPWGYQNYLILIKTGVEYQKRRKGEGKKTKLKQTLHLLGFTGHAIGTAGCFSSQRSAAPSASSILDAGCLLNTGVNILPYVVCTA